MSNKVLIFIVVGGLGAVVLLGLSIEYVLKSNPGLRESIKFKQAIARDFGFRGVDEVALRNLRGNSYELVITGTIPEDEAVRERLDEDLADYFVRVHTNKRAHKLTVSYHEPKSWGCSTAALAEPHHVKEILLQPIRRHIKRVERQLEASAEFEEWGCKVLAWRFEKMNLEVSIEVPPTAPEDLQGLAQKIERVVRGRLRGLYSTVRIELLEAPTVLEKETTPGKQDAKKETAPEKQDAPPVEAKVLFDETFDRRGVMSSGKRRAHDRSSRARMR